MAAYRSALADEPGDARARSQLGKALAESGALAEAETELRRALAQEPEIGVAQVETNLGRVLLALRRPGEASEHYRRAVEFLETSLERLKAGESPEFIALELRAALEAIGEIVGRTDVEEILGEIFSSFCIGK